MKVLQEKGTYQIYSINNTKNKILTLYRINMRKCNGTVDNMINFAIQRKILSTYTLHEVKGLQK